jgi:hypothetical protein
MSVKTAARIADAVASSRGQLDQVRAEVDRLRGELEIETSRPVPTEVIEARIDRTVARLRSFVPGQLSLGDLLMPDGNQIGDYLARLKLSPFEIAAVMAPAELKGWLMSEVARVMATLPEPADDATRTKRVAGLKRQLRAAEVREVGLSWEMANSGLDPDWRGDLDPDLVLGLTGQEDA